MRETNMYCDLCGERISEDENSEMWNSNEYNVNIGQLDEESDYGLCKDLCPDCAEKVYETLRELDWEN